VSSRSLAEPAVLATTKRRLFGPEDEPGRYVVADTQFTVDEWLDGAGELREATLLGPSVYHSPTLFQYKTMLYHAGLLAETGGGAVGDRRPRTRRGRRVDRRLRL